MKGKERNYNDCPSGKNKYETEEEAKIAVRESWLLRNIHLSYYFCLQCHHFHMTSRKEKIK